MGCIRGNADVVRGTKPIGGIRSKDKALRDQIVNGPAIAVNKGIHGPQGKKAQRGQKRLRGTTSAGEKRQSQYSTIFRQGKLEIIWGDCGIGPVENGIQRSLLDKNKQVGGAKKCKCFGRKVGLSGRKKKKKKLGERGTTAQS